MPNYPQQLVSKVLEKAQRQPTKAPPTQPEGGVSRATPNCSDSKPPPKTELAPDPKRINPETAKQKPRKRKSAAERQDQLIGVRCTEAEAELIKQISQQLGLKPGRCLVVCTLQKTAEILKNHKLFSEITLQHLVEKLVARAKACPQQPKQNNY